MLRVPHVLPVVLIDVKLVKAAGLISVVRGYVLWGGVELVIAVLRSVAPALAGIFIAVICRPSAVSVTMTDSPLDASLLFSFPPVSFL